MNMWRFVFILAVSSAFSIASSKNIGSVALGSKNGSSHGKAVVCTVSVAAEFQESKFKIENIDLNLCTHLICIDNIWDKTIEPWNARVNQTEKIYKRFTSLHQIYPHLKISLAAKYHLLDYVRIATNYERRQKFVEIVTDFVSRHKFDGLDLIWDFSERRDIQPAFSEKILLLVKDLRNKFERHNLLLSSTFIALDKPIADAIKVAELSQHLDLLHVVPKYSYIETWPGSFRVEDVLKERSNSNIEESINSLIESGISPAKLILGMDFLGLLFHSVLYLSPKTATFRRAMGYNDICRLLSNSKQAEWTRTYDEDSGLAVAKDELDSWRGILRPTNVVLFESGRSIANKVKFAANTNLAGAMAFPIDMDDFRGIFGIDEDTFVDFNIGAAVNMPNRHNATQPLLKIINYAFDLSMYEKTQARLPEKRKISSESEKINEIETNDVTSKIPDRYKPLIPLVWSVNDAMVVGYDKLHEKAELYSQDQSYKNLMLLYLMKMSRMIVFLLGATMFGKWN